MKRRPDNPRLFLQELQRNDFSAFCKRAYPIIRGGDQLQWNWHLSAIARVLEEVNSGSILRGILNVPPRYLKSMMASVMWVAWVLGRDPTHNFVCISYSNELSAKFGRDCLAIMQSSWYRELFPNTIISAKRSASYDFETTRGGGRLATSISGTLTGRGGDTIIIDDAIKPDEAYSETIREAVNTWFRTTLSSRLDNKTTGAILIVMQRLHEHDLVGTVLESRGWHQLVLPAIEWEDRVVPLAHGKSHTSRVGDVLHAAREPLSTLDELRASMGSAAFEAQYLQRPLPAIGNVILAVWLKTYLPTFNPYESGGYIVQSWDTASKDNPHNDYSVCVTAHVRGREVRVLDVFRRRLKFPELKQHAIRLAREWKPSILLIEDQASGTQLVQAFRSDEPAGVPAPIACQPEGDKVSRIMGVSGQIEAGQLLLPTDAHWLADFKGELLGFPNVRYDDQCDALSQLMSWIQRREMFDTGPLAGPIGMTFTDDGSIHYSGDTEQLLGATYGSGYDQEDPWL